MKKAKITFEQYCTHIKRNVVMEEIIFDNGVRKIACVEKCCNEKECDCKNKIRQNN